MTDDVNYIDELPIEYKSLQNILSNQFGLVVSNLKPANYDGYIGQSQYNEIVNIFSPRSPIFIFSFDKIITIDDGKVVAMLNSPIIQSILDDINKTLCVTEGMRLTNDGLTYIPVLTNVKPWLVFKYNNKLEFMTIEIQFLLNNLCQGDFPYELTTKNVSIDSAYKREGFKKIYSITGELIQDELAGYRSKLLDVWLIPEDSIDIDYYRLGVLSDMITI